MNIHYYPLLMNAHRDQYSPEKKNIPESLLINGTQLKKYCSFAPNFVGFLGCLADHPV